MPRVNLVDASKAHASVRPFYAKGNPGPIPQSLANVPEVMQVALPFLGRVLGPSTIDFRTKEIAILRASALQKCRYCTQTHTVVALAAGLAENEVRALRGDGNVAATFPQARERALISWTDAVTLGPNAVDDSVARQLKAHFSEPDVVELTLLIGATVMLNRYATALDLPTSEEHLAKLSALGLT